MNIKEFLERNWVDYKLYSLTQIEIKDILIYDKEITQKVEQTFLQVLEKDWEKNYEPYKIEKSKYDKFDKKDFKIGKTHYTAIEPGTIEFTECKTCDGHGEMRCPTCSWKGELECPTCKWKGQYIREEAKIIEKKDTCTVCRGQSTAKQYCPHCKGQKTVKTYPPCKTCKGEWMTMQLSTYDSWSPLLGNNNWNQRGINLNQSKQLCPSCNWRKVEEQIVPCPKCNWTGDLIIKCKWCNWIWIKTTSERIMEKKIIECRNCSSTWRCICTTCRWKQDIVCPTCRWERKTYQFTQNRFTLTISPKYRLLSLSSKVEDDATQLLALEQINKVTDITNEEKELLLKYGQTYFTKITPEILSKKDWIIFKLTSLNGGQNYYIYYSNYTQEYYYSSLPPKDLFSVKVQDAFKKIWSLSKKWFEKGKELVHKIDWTNKY